MSNEFILQPFGKAGRNFILNSDAFLNIAVGSVRSGKTIAAIYKFFLFILNSPHNVFAMAGKTITTLIKNVVRPFMQILDTCNIKYNYNHYNQELTFNGNVIALFGVDKEGADARIQGFTCAGALIDEATVMPRSGFQMLLSRNSLPGASIFVTCNPSSPMNYIYTDYVNNQELLASGRCKVFNFLLSDNLTLSKEYVQNLKSMYAPGSVFYKRHILNQWVSGQGAIFDSFTDDNILHGNIKLNDYINLGVGSDYGISTTTCYSLVGKHKDGYYDVIAERYYDAQREARSQTDAERLTDILQLQKDYQLDETVTFWCSHDAGSLKTLLETSPEVHMNIDVFMPDTLECIQRISNLFHENKLRIHESCTETIKQVQGYEWDLKAGQKGIDKPVKKNDHLVDSMRAPIMHDLTGQKILGGIAYI